MKREYDVIVVGGGPAGMMAAGRAAERGFSVLLIEKNDVLGKKLSITGGGRCNITNAEFDARKLLHHYGEAEQFLYSPFAQFGVQDTFSFFEKRGLPVIVLERNRAFPETERATDVTRVMERYLRDHRVTVLLNVPVEGFKTERGAISGVITGNGTFTARAYVIASGGKSHGETGSTGEGISWLSALGHQTHEPNPNLVPLVVADSWVKKLAGITLQNAKITFTEGKQKLVKRGNILCTHFGLSGPTILNVAGEVKEMLGRGSVTATIDLFPDDDTGALREKFSTLLLEHSNKTVENALKSWFPKGVASAILSSFEASVGKTKAHSAPREVRHRIVDAMKTMPVTVIGTMGYDWAIVSDGGVDLSEVDTKTMRSRLHENLYFVGDVLHVRRPSGGYSLQLCWTTGYVAGENILRDEADTA